MKKTSQKEKNAISRASPYDQMDVTGPIVMTVEEVEKFACWPVTRHLRVVG